MNIAREVLSRAEQVPHRVGLWSEAGEGVTFSEIDRRSRQITERLLRAGLRSGDRLGVYLANSPDLVFLLLGALRAGIVYVPANLMLQASELAHILRDAHCRALVADPTRAEIVSEATAGLELGWIAALAGPASEAWLDLSAAPEVSGTTDVLDVPADHEAFVIYTSGTTGLPKGAVQTHGSMASWLRTQGERARGRPGPYELMPEGTPPNINAMPLSHGTGLLTLFYAYHVGRGVVLMRRFQIEGYLRLAERHRVDNLFGAPTMFQMLANAEEAERFDLSSVKVAMSGGAPLPPAVAQRFEERFGAPLIQIYGQTETGPIAAWSPKDIRSGVRRPGSVGKICPGVELRIEDDARSVLPPGDVGEVVVRSPSIMAGYLGHGSSETGAIIRDGWVYTGDLGYIDAEGWLFITGRKRDLIIVGGFNVYPAELENVLLQHPKVKEAVVVGVPDPRLGEIPGAYVVADAVSEGELIEFVRERVAHYKAVRRVVFCDELPKGETRKVLVHELQQRARAGGA